MIDGRPEGDSFQQSLASDHTPSGIVLSPSIGRGGRSPLGTLATIWQPLMPGNGFFPLYSLNLQL